jgi:hypothetical protein
MFAVKSATGTLFGLPVVGKVMTGCVDVGAGVAVSFDVPVGVGVEVWVGDEQVLSQI